MLLARVISPSVNTAMFLAVFENAATGLRLSGALLFLVEYMPQTTCLHPALSYAAASIFPQLYLYPAVHISFSRSLFQVSLGLRLPLWHCGGVDYSTCLVMLSSFLLEVCPSQFHFLLRIWSSTGSWPVFSHNSLSDYLRLYHMSVVIFWLAHTITYFLWYDCRKLITKSNLRTS